MRTTAKSSTQNNQDRELLDVIGVHSNAHQRFITECTFQLERIRAAQELIMQRQLRECVQRIGDLVYTIIDNCKADPNDIREEIGLATELKLLADSIFDFAELRLSGAYRTKDGSVVSERIAGNLFQAGERYNKLLEKMKNNDAEHPLSRAKVVSRILDMPAE